MDNTRDSDNPFVRDGHDSAPVELTLVDLLYELNLAFSCYIAWDWKDGEFDELGVQKAYRKIRELLKIGHPG